MRALFEVGEEVILCSKNQPNLNGESVVIKSASGSTILNCPHCEKRIEITSPGFGYFLKIKSNSIHGCCQPFDESAIRKKHKGSKFSFNEMISEIKSTEKINA
jgi:hypothetical protein